MSKKKLNRYSIKDMLLNEEKAAGYFPGMYLIYDIPEDEDVTTYAKRKKDAFEAIKNQIMAQVKTITGADALEEPNVPQDQAKKLAPAKSLGSVILGDAFTSEELNNLLSDSPADDKGKVRTVQQKKEDIEDVLGKSANRLPQLQKLFIQLLGEEEGKEVSLKKIDQKNLKTALLQLGNKGLSGDKVGAMFDKAGQEIVKQAGPMAGRVKEEDLPVIDAIKDQVVAILKGDLSSLREQKIHPGTARFLAHFLGSVTEPTRKQTKKVRGR